MQPPLGGSDAPSNSRFWGRATLPTLRHAPEQTQLLRSERHPSAWAEQRLRHAAPDLVQESLWEAGEAEEGEGAAEEGAEPGAAERQEGTCAEGQVFRLSGSSPLWSTLQKAYA